MVSGVDYCVSCGRVIPEGDHICTFCKTKYNQPINIVVIKKENSLCSLLRKIKERIFKK